MNYEDLFTAAATRPLIVSDVDGILAWYPQAATQAVNLQFGMSYSPYWTSYRGPFKPKEQKFLTELREGDFAETFFSSLAPDTEGIEALRMMAEEGFGIVVASDRPSKVRHVTQTWLEHWGVPFESVYLMGPGGKTELAAQHGPNNPMILIDDSSARWLDVPRPGVTVVAPRRSYMPATTPPGVEVFPSWKELTAHVLTEPSVLEVA